MLLYKWNGYCFQLLWIGPLVTIPYVALQFRRNSDVLKYRARSGEGSASRMCADPGGHDPMIWPAELSEVIRQYDSCNTGELDRHAQHQQPCLASRMLRVIVRQKQPVLSGTHCSSFAHRQMSAVLCLRRFPMKIENCHIRHQRPLKVHQRPPR